MTSPSRQAPSLPSSASSSWESLKSYVSSVASQVSDLVLRELDSLGRDDDESRFGGNHNSNNKVFLYIPTDTTRDGEATK
jgi:hypothetical protein